MNRQAVRLCVPAAVVCALAAEVFAADVKPQPTSQIVVVTTTKVKPGMAKEWETIQNDISNAYQKIGIPFRNVWQTSTFGDMYTYHTASPIAKFADLDGDGPLLK